jgi:acetate kinase
MGVEIDLEKNSGSPMDADIAMPQSAVRILIIKAREDWQIALECQQLLAFK